MINTYKPADSLVTIPIIPYVNKSAAYTCSFPVSVYGPQQATDPNPLANGEVCGNSLTPGGTQLTDNNILANNIANSTTLQQQWMQHLVGTFGTAANGGVKFYQLDNEPYAWSNIHRDVMPVQATYPTITQLSQQYAAVVKQVDSTALILGPSDWSGGWIGDTTTQNGLSPGNITCSKWLPTSRQMVSASWTILTSTITPTFPHLRSSLPQRVPYGTPPTTAARMWSSTTSTVP